MIDSAVEGKLCDGTTFRVTAYTWTTRPDKGVCFDVFFDDILAVQNCDALYAAALIQDRVLKLLENMVPVEER